jgi:hypothetical protein
MQGLNYVTAMVCGVVALLSGLVVVMTLGDSEMYPFGWLLIIIGLGTLMANFLLRRQSR